MNKNSTVFLTSPFTETPNVDDFSHWTHTTSVVLSHPFNVHFIFIDETSMAIKNANLRKQFGPTDIITLVANEPFSGSIYFCHPFVVKKHPSIKNPYAYLTVHGLLHLASYEHERDHEYQKMLTLERTILNTIGLQHPEDPKND